VDGIGGGVANANLGMLFLIREMIWREEKTNFDTKKETKMSNQNNAKKIG